MKPLSSIATIEQEINDSDSNATIHFDVHNDYIDAEQVAYEEIASVVPNKDDPHMFCLTFRVWFIGLLFIILQAFLQQYSWYGINGKYELGSGLVILASFLLGQLFALVLPKKDWPIGSEYRFSFNPGPFTFKEHILICVMNNAAVSSGINLTTPFYVQRLYDHKSINCIIEILFNASLHLMAFGIAGVIRRFLVWPSVLLWPENFPDIILIRTLSNQLVDDSFVVKSNSSWKLSRLKLFLIATICQCVYFWIPNCLMPILLLFDWLCWINPNNLILSQLTGIAGFGIGSLQFDWRRITRIWNSPIIVPFWAKINVLIGFVSIVWVLSPLSFFTNIPKLRFSSIRETLTYRRTIDDDDDDYIISPLTEELISIFNGTKYKFNVEDYGKSDWSVARVLQLGFAFMLITSLIIHTILYHGNDILKQARTSVSNRDNDIHCCLMSKYPDTPEWWFILMFGSSLTTAILICYYGQLIEWYYVLLAVTICCILTLPYGLIRANTGFQVIMDTVPLFIGSLLFFEKPIGFLTFHLYSTYLLIDTLVLVSTLKLCHYTKIPPRNVFITLVVGRLVAVVVRYVVGSCLLSNMRDMCHTNDEWICPMKPNALETAIRWTYSGPRIWFSGMYKPLLWLLLIGAVLPVPFWLLHKKCPNIRWLKHVHIPIFLMPAAYWIATSSGETFSWLLFSFLCYSLIHRWWYDRYSLLFSIAMDTGIAISGPIVAFLFNSKHLQYPQWWGATFDDKCPLAGGSNLNML